MSQMTEDVDIVVHVDDRNITADYLTTLLLQQYPDQYGHKIPTYRLGSNEDEILVELEVFDQAAWPQHPQ